jgi:small subunit ribosomal protein S19
MNRSLWKGPFFNSSVFKQKKSKITKIWCRSSVIPSSLIGETVFVHNGREFKRIFINREKIGFKFGEFSLTRKYQKKIKAVKKSSKIKK